MPCIYYKVLIDGHRIWILVLYPEALNIDGIENINTAWELEKIIAPNAPSPNNKQGNEVIEYLDIFEKSIELADGKTVTAMIMQSIQYSYRRDYYHIYMDGILLEIFGDPEVFTDDFFASFSIKPYVDTIPQ